MMYDTLIGILNTNANTLKLEFLLLLIFFTISLYPILMLKFRMLIYFPIIFTAQLQIQDFIFIIKSSAKYARFPFDQNIHDFPV